MSRIGYLILSVLSKNQAFDKISAMTAREISEAEEFGYKINTIYKAICSFQEDGYISLGYKDGKQNSFFLTESGKKLLKEQKI